MTSTTVNSSNVATKFLNQVAREYVRGSRFSKYQGKGPNNVITIKEGLKTVSIPLVAKLGGAGVTGSATLAGKEENLNNYAMTLTPTHYRNGVLIDNEENEKTEFDLFTEARPALMNWAKELQRDHIIEALGAIDNGTTYANYGSATNAAMDTWLSNNRDRVLYGAVKSNHSSLDHSTALGLIDSSADKLSASMVSLAKRIAKTASPLITPIKTSEDEDWFVMFVDSMGFRDLKADTTILAAHEYAAERGKDNPLFTGGDIIYDGVIIREIEEISAMIDGTASNGKWGASATANSLATSGSSTSRVGVGFLCGTQAVSYGLGKMPNFQRRKEDDYGFQNGVGIELKHQIKKSMFNNKQHGMVTVFYSAAVDA